MSGVISTALRHLIAAGVAGDDLVRAVEEMEAAQAKPKSSGAARQAAYIARKKAEEEAGHVTNDVTHVTDVISRQQEKVSPKKSESIPLSHSPPISPPFPIAEALAVWNEMAERTGLPKALGATGKRQGAMKARLAEHGEDGFRQAVAAVERSKFCRGDNDRGWRADIGFMLRPDNFAKLIEGGYDPAGSSPRKPAEPYVPQTPGDCERSARFWEDQGKPDKAAEMRARADELRATGPPPAIAAIISNAGAALRSNERH